MPNTSSFLPSQRDSLHKSCCLKLNSALLLTIRIFLKTTSNKNTFQRTKDKQITNQQTPLYGPITLRRCRMIRTRCWGHWIYTNPFQFLFIILLKRNFRIGCLMLTHQWLKPLIIQCNYNHFCIRCYLSTRSIPKLN